MAITATDRGAQTSMTTTPRNDADGANLATSTVSDSGGQFTRGEWA